jgi:hypothetical protein
MDEAGFGRDGSGGGAGGCGVTTTAGAGARSGSAASGPAAGAVFLGGTVGRRRFARGGVFGRAGRDAARFARPDLPRAFERAVLRGAARFFGLRRVLAIARRRFLISFLRRFSCFLRFFASFLSRLRSCFSRFLRFFRLPIESSGPGSHSRPRDCRARRPAEQAVGGDS